MTGHVGLAMRSALLPFEKALQLVKVTTTRPKGVTSATEAAAVGFRGAIAPASSWKKFIAPGGVISSTQPVLVVSSDLKSAATPPAALVIAKNDIVVGPKGTRYEVVASVDADEDLGINLFTLEETGR